MFNSLHLPLHPYPLPSQDIPAAPAEDVVSFDSAEGIPTSLFTGERDDELLVVTSKNIIFRRCIQNTACIGSQRNLRVAQVDNGNDNAEFFLRGICTLRAKRTFLVVVINKVEGLSIDRIYECPLAPSSTLSITRGDCSIFAIQPGEQDVWDPFGLLYDEGKNIIYVSDKDNQKIHIFDTDRNFISRLEQQTGDLSFPTGMAIQPGIFAPLSAVIPPSSATSGTVTFSSLLKVRGRMWRLSERCNVLLLAFLTLPSNTLLTSTIRTMPINPLTTHSTPSPNQLPCSRFLRSQHPEAMQLLEGFCLVSPTLPTASAATSPSLSTSWQGNMRSQSNTEELQTSICWALPFN